MTLISTLVFTYLILFFTLRSMFIPYSILHCSCVTLQPFFFFLFFKVVVIRSISQLKIKLVWSLFGNAVWTQVLVFYVQVQSSPVVICAIVVCEQRWNRRKSMYWGKRYAANVRHSRWRLASRRAASGQSTKVICHSMRRLSEKFINFDWSLSKHLFTAVGEKGKARSRVLHFDTLNKVYIEREGERRDTVYIYIHFFFKNIYKKIKGTLGLKLCCVSVPFIFWSSTYRYLRRSWTN